MPESEDHRPRILLVDWGTKRIGLALSDPTATIAQPLPYIERRSEARAAAAVADVVRANRVGRIVVGLPRNMDGSEGPAAVAARRFGGRLAACTAAPVEFWDERLTTAAAERAMVAAGVSRSRRREARDGVAAAWMLQGYLARRRASEDTDASFWFSHEERLGGSSVTETVVIETTRGEVEVTEGRGNGHQVITVSDEEGHEHRFAVLEHVEVDDRQYVVVVPAGAAEDEPATVLRVEDDDTLVGVDDDDEFQRVVDELEQQSDDIEIELADSDPVTS